MNQVVSEPLNESYDEKGLLKKGLTHAVYSKGPSGQIHFTTRRKKLAHAKVGWYTNDVRTRQRLSGSKNVHPGFGVKIVPHGTPNGKSVHKDHEKYYGKTDESVELDEGIGKAIGGLVSAGVKGAKMCAGNALCRKAAIAAGKWGIKKLKDKFQNKKDDKSKLERSPDVNYIGAKGPSNERKSLEDVVDYIGAKGPTKLPEYTDTDMQPDYSHPSFNANFVNARAKLERDRWLAKHGKRSRKSKNRC